MSKKWKHIDTEDAQYVGTLEFEGENGEQDYTEVLRAGSNLVFGSPTNNTFLQSGYIEIDDFESLNDTLSELREELETYYRDGPEYTSRMVFNERM